MTRANENANGAIATGRDRWVYNRQGFLGITNYRGAIRPKEITYRDTVYLVLATGLYSKWLATCRDPAISMSLKHMSRPFG